tara:strand:+ start:1472 stop:1903 length:432 start_codon:yes stop_codon:yes gene_type:complete
MGQFLNLRSAKGSHFTGAIAQNAQEAEDLTGLAWNKIVIRGVMIQADQQLRFRVIFWAKDSLDDTDLDADAYIGEVEVDLVAYGYQIAGANQYYLDIRGLALDYQDEDSTNELHISLQNLSAAAKNAGATGEVVVEISYEESR